MTEATQPAADFSADQNGPSADELAEVFDLGFMPTPDPEAAPAVKEPSVGADGDKGGVPEPTPAAPPASPPAADPSTAQPASQEPAQPAPAAPLPTPTPEQLELAALRAEVAALKAPPANPAQPEAATEAAPTAQEENKPRFPLLQLPNEIKEGLTSDDPDLMVGAISALTSGLANTIYATVLKDLEPKFAALDTAIKAPIQAKAQEDELTAAAEVAKAQRENYFKHFPAHNNPKLMPIIQSELQALLTAHPTLKFDDTFIAALGARVNAYLKDIGAPEPVAQPAPTPSSPTPPPATIPAGTRPSDGVSLADEVEDLLFGD